MKYKLLLPLLAAVATSGSAAPPSADGGKWGGGWGYATSPATKAVRDTLPAGTYRYRLRSSQSGDGVSFVFTNPAGAVPLEIIGATVAHASTDEGFGLDEATRMSVTFNAGSNARIEAGISLTSHAVDLIVKAGDDLILTIQTGAPSTTVGGNAGFPVAFSEAAIPADGAGLEPRKLRPFITRMAVRNPPAACTVVTMGDSITEGARGTRTGWRGWPGVLARRLAERKGPHCGVVNMGISGNRLLRDGRGTAAVDRFDRDIASVPGVTHLILLEGINDIWRSATPGEPPVAAADLIAGYRRIIDMAHTRGIRVIGGTMTPGWGSKYLSREMEQVRQETNQWIRKGGGFDAVIDFEAALRDGGSPPAIKRPFDSGDKLHPGDNGYEAMGRAVSLSPFQPPSS
ncbi:SGNH/GDSL hydrolase family protein [Sphingobium sp.]|uniref:SGNH/GDSL hydrolase family protein n=1 Tax=Sphingobium sp. TaxID=1912891 RepID=UPI002BB3765A|nr:SGNH/GDSL hydrolase family protein [Sphingobium sp.]HUD92360.1 SGNH/GDSL hydrolase family protein [Sphingobium sp.]